MKLMMEKFYAYLDRPIFGWSRIALAVLAIPMVLSLSAPLWQISMVAPQYPKGLTLDIYAHKLEGGNEGRDLPEINTLNHYIGMHHIDRSEFNELDWMPFAILGLVLLALRCAAIGNVRMLIDLAVITFFVSAYSLGRFVYKLYVYGHDLDPKAPLTVEPFTPAIFGKKQIANFATESWPQMGTVYISVFIFGVLGITAAHLIIGRLRARRNIAV